MIIRFLPKDKTSILLRIYVGRFNLLLLASLILLSPMLSPFLQITRAQTNWVTIFQDDFEDGNAGQWRLDSGWQVEQEGANYALSGFGRSVSAHARFRQILKDYRFNLRIKLINEGVHLNVRESNTGRYFIGVNEWGISLNKQFYPDTFFNDLARADFPITMGQWHTISILAQGNNIQVSVDGVKRVDYIDNQSPLLQGVIALEKIWDENSHVHFDDVEVIGEPPPPPDPIPSNWKILFKDDFEGELADGWNLGPEWNVELDDGKYVLSGEGHHWAEPDIIGWVDCVIEGGIKLLTGGVHFSFRKSDQRISATERIASRYFLGLMEDSIYLGKQVGSVFSTLFSGDIYVPKENWHTVRIVIRGASIKAYIDNELVADVVDSDNPLLFGIFAFETLPDSHVHFDDLVVFGQPSPVSSSRYVWEKTGGPSGGLGYDVRIHPLDKKVMFVTDNPSGVNKSYDAGITWTQKNKGITTRTGPSLDGIPIFSLTIDPNNPDIVWAGTQSAKGIYKSTDGGETWVKKDRGVVEGDEISFRNFGIHPQNSNIVYAGGEITTGIFGKEFDKTKGKIYKTGDGGENWRCVWAGGNLVRFVLFDPTNPNIMYASTGIFDREAYNDLGVGILKSNDGGETWFQINNGIKNLFIGFLEMHPTNSKILFAAAGNNAWSYPPNNLKGGVYRTTNGGENWEEVLSDDIFTAVTISPSTPNVVYAGSGGAFYRSDDNGNTWQKFWKSEERCWGPPGIRAGIPIGAVVDPYDPYTIFANNYGGGVFKSTDGGQTWVDSSKGYTGAALYSIATNSYSPAIAYTIVTNGGPFRTYNGGESWEGLSFGPASYGVWGGLSLSPKNPQEVIISDGHQGVILRSTNGGNNWEEVFRHPSVNASNPLNRHGFYAISHSPSNSNVVYAGMKKEKRAINGDMPRGPSFGMYKSADGGETWVEINNGLKTSLININCIAVHPTNPDIVYIGTWRDGVFKTTNGGQSWVMKNNGLVSADVRSLAIDPKNPEVVYAGLGDGVGIFKTTNGGELWGEINTGLNLVCPSNLLPAGKVKVGISLEQPLRRAVGADYYSVPWTTLSSIVLNPTNSQTIYASDHQSGVYMSTNGGTNWVPINEGLSTRAVTAMAISSDGKVLYAATEGEGVFRLNTNLFSDVPSDYWAEDYIVAIYDAGITTGCAQDDPNTPENERRYCPEDNVTRGQMAAFIIRAKYGENFSYTTTPYSTDVPSTHTFFKYVQKLKDDGITAVSGIYGVDNEVTRGQMAAFIIRSKYGENFTYTQAPYFTDVPSTHGFFKYVQKLKDEGITAVTGTYGVDNIVTRAQMAAFLARAFLGME